MLGIYLNSIFLLLASDNSLYSSKYVLSNSLYNSEASFFLFVFLEFLKNSAGKECFDLKESLLNFLLSQ